MSATIQIEVSGDGVARGGDTLQVRVTVYAHEDVRCKSLTFSYVWATDGAGNEDTATLAEQTYDIYEEMLPAGDQRSWDFTIEVPPLPVTFHGHYIRIDHYLSAELHVPWGKNIQGERNLFVYPGPTPGGGYGYDDDLRQRAGMKKSRTGETTAVIGIGVALVSALTYAFGTPLWYLLATAGVITGAVIGLLGLRRIRARKALGDEVAIDVPSWRVHPGAHLPVRVHFTPTTNLNVGGITLLLRGTETAVEGSGSDQETFTHTLAESEHALAGPCQLRPGEPVGLSTHVPIPEAAAPSFHAPNNSITWELELYVAMVDRADWNDKRKLVVRPWFIPELTGGHGQAQGQGQGHAHAGAGSAAVG